MRTIQFRAWDKKEKRMISTEEFVFSPYFIQADGKVINMDSSAPLIDEDGDGSNKYDELPYELMQFTGLTDKNGKEIYEGDIVSVEFGGCETHIDNYVGQVDYDYGKFWVVEHNGYGGQGYDFDRLCNKDLYNNTAKLEVVGNIYENPEQLTNN